MKYEKLFSPVKLGPLELKNRIVFPACATQFDLEGGYVSDKTIKWYDSIAKGGAGMIIIQALGVHHRPSGNLLRLKDDS
jgi:2,4-dienoyl-CoA reductase-like NADH-dependent reductase (Old Yellow Enzyme family)